MENECISNCPDIGYFENAVTNKCQSCHNTCVEKLTILMIKLKIQLVEIGAVVMIKLLQNQMKVDQLC